MKFEFYEIMKMIKNGDSFSKYSKTKKDALEKSKNTFVGLTKTEQENTDIVVMGYYITIPDNTDTSDVEAVINGIYDENIECPEYVGWFPDDTLIFSASLKDDMEKIKTKLLKRAEEFAKEASEAFAESCPEGFGVENVGVGFIVDNDGDLEGYYDTIDFIDDRKELQEGIIRNMWSNKKAYLYIVDDDDLGEFIDTKYGVKSECELKDINTFDMEG